MSLIDGVGDEVTEFFLLLTVILVGVGAWWSTAINQRFRIRTVLILEHRLSNSTQLTNNNTQIASASSADNQQNSNTVVEESTETGGSEGNEEETIVESTAQQSIEEIEQNTIVERMDSGDTNNLRQRRIAYFQSNDLNNDNVQSQETTSTNNIENNSDNTKQNETNNDTGNSSTSDLIRIKLKYLNDEIKSVDGKLWEKLGDFKRRHFEVELAACKLVRLIFNGQVLQKDSATLKACGLFDNCVVHCLIHQQPANSQQSNSNGNSLDDNNGRTTRLRHSIFSSTSALPAFNFVDSINIDGDTVPSNFLNQSRNGIGNSGNAAANGGSENTTANMRWDLGNLLLALISLLLSATWYFRFEYAQLFTVSATVFLLCLTGLFTILLVGVLYPDIWNTRNNNNSNQHPQTQQQS